MIDIHSHIVFNVDDGPPSIKESIRMVLEAEKLGINEIFATPHYNNILFHTNETAHNFAVISTRTADCDVKLHLGYEVSLNPFIVEKVEELKTKTLGGSSYILFELPFDHIPIYTGELLYKLNMEKIIPILAHPERNKIFINNFDSFIKFLENGCLVQIDAASIVGVYGTDARHIAEKIIKLNLAHFVASDAHCAEDYRNWYLPAYSQVKRWAGVEYSEKVFYKNAKKIADENCNAKKIADEISNAKEIADENCNAKEIAGEICKAKEIANDICNVKEIAGEICNAKEIANDICNAKEIADEICNAEKIADEICKAKEIVDEICKAKEIVDEICNAKEIADEICKAISQSSTDSDSSLNKESKKDERETKYNKRDKKTKKFHK